MSWEKEHTKQNKKREATYCSLPSLWRNPEVLDWNRHSRNGGEGIACNRSMGKAEGLTGGKGCHRTVKATSSLGNTWGFLEMSVAVLRSVQKGHWSEQSCVDCVTA